MILHLLQNRIIPSLYLVEHLDFERVYIKLRIQHIQFDHFDPTNSSLNRKL